MVKKYVVRLPNGSILLKTNRKKRAERVAHSLDLRLEVREWVEVPPEEEFAEE